MNNDEDKKDEQEPIVEEVAKTMTAIPTINTYNKRYALTLTDEKKAIKLFIEYESRDMFNRLKREILAVAQSKVPEAVCERALGKSRRVKHGSYEKWAKNTLLFFAGK
jgi:hypothetical protein